MKSQAELLTSLTNAEEQDKQPSSKLVTNEPIEGAAGIRVTGNDETGYYATIGKYILSDKYNTPEEVIKAVKRKDWQILFAAMSAITSNLIKTIESTTK